MFGIVRWDTGYGTLFQLFLLEFYFNFTAGEEKILYGYEQAEDAWNNDES